MRTRNYAWLACLLWLTAGLFAQQLTADPTPQPEAPAAAATAAPPAPGSEVMRPTEHGLRFTPAMARGLGRAIASDAGNKFKLPRDRQQEVSDKLARRFMDTARKHQEEGQAVVEYGFEAIWRSVGTGQPMKFTPEVAREFGTRANAAMPPLHELFNGMIEDIGPALPPDGRANFDREMKKAFEQFTRFETRMQRWSQGQIQPGEGVFEDFDEPASQPAKQADGKPAEKPRSPEVQQAERQAEWSLSSSGPGEWRTFLALVKQSFKFDDQQSTKADQILSDFTAKADAIMTPEWKEKMRQNRTKTALKDHLKDVPTRPWFWRMQHEYDTAMKPIQELGWEFRKQVLALLTPQQRDAAAAEISKRAAEHGLTLDENDKLVLGIAGSKWSLWKF